MAMLLCLLSCAKIEREIDGAETSNVDLRVLSLGARMSSMTDFDARTPHLPFSERSAKTLYKTLLDLDELLNREELKTLQLCRQAIKATKGKKEVKVLLLESEAELAVEKACLFANNELQCRTRKVLFCRSGNRDGN